MRKPFSIVWLSAYVCRPEAILLTPNGSCSILSGSLSHGVFLFMPFGYWLPWILLCNQSRNLQNSKTHTFQVHTHSFRDIDKMVFFKFIMLFFLILKITKGHLKFLTEKKILIIPASLWTAFYRCFHFYTSLAILLIYSFWSLPLFSTFHWNLLWQTCQLLHILCYHLCFISVNFLWEN